MYLVESHVLNEHCGDRSHDHSSNRPVMGHITRGLCLSEVQNVRHMVRHGANAVPEVVSIEQVWHTMQII